MTAYDKDRQLLQDAANRGILLSMPQARVLRRAAGTLRRWALEEGCGTGNEWASFSIKRDDTGRPFRTVYPRDHQRPTSYAIPDREAGALTRVKRVCQTVKLHYFYQTDARGCALYIDREPLSDCDYVRGVACDI